MYSDYFKTRVSAETNCYYDFTTGLWFAEIGIWYEGNYLVGITRGGYAKQSTAKQQVTRLYNQRFDHAFLFNYCDGVK